jgi:hypothetical protein
LLQYRRFFARQSRALDSTLGIRWHFNFSLHLAQPFWFSDGDSALSVSALQKGLPVVTTPCKFACNIFVMIRAFFTRQSPLQSVVQGADLEVVSASIAKGRRCLPQEKHRNLDPQVL